LCTHRKTDTWTDNKGRLKLSSTRANNDDDDDDSSDLLDGTYLQSTRSLFTATVEINNSLYPDTARYHPAQTERECVRGEGERGSVRYVMLELNHSFIMLSSACAVRHLAVH